MVDPALDHLHAVEIGSIRIARGPDEEARRLASAALRQVGPHRHAGVIGAVDIVERSIIEREAAEEAQADARAAGAVDLAPAQGIEDFAARVCRRPCRGQAGSAELPVVLHRAADAFQRPFRRGFGAKELAEEIPFLRSRKAGVAIGAANQAELERILPRLVFVQQPLQEARAGIFIGQHVFRLGRGAVDVGGVPGLEIGEFVGWREHRMGLAVAFYLGHFEQRLPACAHAGIVGIDMLAIEADRREHAAVGEIAIVRDRQRMTAKLLVMRQRIPQVLGIVAVIGGEGHDARRLFGIVAIENHPVEIVAGDHTGPFIADQRGEVARLVVAVGQRGDVCPYGAAQLFRHLRQRAFAAHGFDESCAQAHLADHFDELAPAPPRRGAGNTRIERVDAGEQAEVLRMVGHGEEIERTAQARFHAIIGGDGLAHGETIGLFRGKRVRALQVCVE